MRAGRRGGWAAGPTAAGAAPALAPALAAPGGSGRLTILAGYTPTIELREEMHRRGWVGRYWEA